MSLEHSSSQPGGFQVRHRTLGVFQGTAVELAFWHPTSEMPEYGLCRFATREKAQAYIDFFSSPRCTEPLDPADLTIEPFDCALHECLIGDNPMPQAWEAPP